MIALGPRPLLASAGGYAPSSGAVHHPCGSRCKRPICDTRVRAQAPPADLDRRQALLASASGAAALALSSLQAACAAAEPTPSTLVVAQTSAAASKAASAEAPQLLGLAREALIQAIATGSDEDVEKRIAALLPLDPSRGEAGVSPALDGTWRLIWSAKAEAFSPLLRLPGPLRPDSFQLLGPPASSEVGEGRVAQLLTGGVLLSRQLWLSSGVKPAPDAPDTLEIFPPFRFELSERAGAPKKTLVEAGSDAEFRSVNLRTAEEQAAPKNRYTQQYLDIGGETGDIRISTIVSGDPVIVGAIFVHQRI